MMNLPIRLKSLLVAAGVLAASAMSGAPAGADTIKFEQREKIIPPYTNQNCLKDCHGEPTIMGGGERGIRRSLYVDVKRYVLSVHGKKGIGCIDCHQGADPNVHPREGYPNVDCRACHSISNAGDYFPYGAAEKLLKRGLEPVPNEARKGKVWGRTRHAWAWENGKPNAPFCDDCHTEHYVLPASDPDSTVNRANIARTCSACHEDILLAGGVGGALARFRVQAHGKGDISGKFSVRECLSCHQGEGAHAEEDLTGQACPRCHLSGEEEGARPFHIVVTNEGEGPAPALAGLYSVLFWAAMIVGALLVLFYGFTSIYRSNADDSASDEDNQR